VYEKKEMLQKGS